MRTPLRRTLLAALLALSTSGLTPAHASTPARPPAAPLAAAQSGQTPSPAQEQAQRTHDDRPTIEVTFVLDTTSSMGGLIEGAKQKIWSIASHIAQGQPTPHLKVGLVAYRDLGDAYVTRAFDLTSDLDAMYGNLHALRAEGGGDTPEHVGKGLGEAVKAMSWNQDRKVMKLIFVVGDAPPHQYQDGFDYRVWAARAFEKGIVVNTIRCGSDQETEVAWREISRLGHGTFTSIANDGGMVAAATPYDEKMAKLNAEIASKTLYGGKAPARAEAERKAEGVKALPASAAADRMEFLSFSARGSGGAMAAAPVAPAGTRDLTADPAAVGSLSDAELPASLQGLSKSEQKAKVETVGRERKALEAEAAQVSRERAEWVSKNQAAKKDSFDAQVMEGVKKQAKTYGVAY